MGRHFATRPPGAVHRFSSTPGIRHLRLVTCVVLLLTLPTLALAELRIASWNIQNFGWGQNRSLPAVASVISQFDIVAIQELMDAGALDGLQQALQEKTGARWEVLYSEPLGRGSYREKYAFVWRSDAVEYLDGAVLYIADRDRFAREPYSARFRAKRTDLAFVLATVHVVYGRRVADRTPEVDALRGYWDWLGEVYPGDAPRRLLLGDFNLRPSHPAWHALAVVAEPLILEGATTLSSNDRRYANLYDNVFVARNHELPITGAGISRFPELLTGISGRYWSHAKARRHVSDHAPVYVLLDGAVVHEVADGPLALPAGSAPPVPGDSRDRDARDRDTGPERAGVPLPDRAVNPCVDLNAASAEELQRIVHVGAGRAAAIEAGRPWTDVGSLTRIPGIGADRVGDMREQGLACEGP